MIWQLAISGTKFPELNLRTKFQTDGRKKGSEIRRPETQLNLISFTLRKLKFSPIIIENMFISFIKVKFMLWNLPILFIQLNDFNTFTELCNHNH